MKLRVLSMLAIVAVFCCGVTQAQVPRKLNYQGFLTSPSGAPINTPQTLVARIYDAASGGNLLFSETHNPVTVSNGIFNLLIGSVDANLNPLNLSFSAQYYLGITVGADPEMSPRQPLAASPYALRAVTAESLAPGGNIVLTDPSTASAGNIMKASSRFIHNPGFANTFIGVDSGNFTVTGSSNTITGANALGNVTSGQSNTASGVFALNGNTSGSYNIALGIGAGGSLTTGDFNINIGNAGVAGESQIIRIGTSQTDTYLTGVVHGNGSGLTGVPTAASFTGALAGDVIGTQSATTITSSTVTSKALTGFVSGAGTVSASDTLLTAINKLDGNVALKAPLTPRNLQQIALLRWYDANLSDNTHFPVGSAPSALAFDGANIWVANMQSHNVTKLRASDGALVGTFAAGFSPIGLVFDGANIWVSDRGSNLVTRLRASDGACVGTCTFSVGSAPSGTGGLAFDGTNIWVAIRLSNKVVRLRASDGACVGTCTFAVGYDPQGLAFDGANIWVTGSVLAKLRASDGVCVGTCTFAVGGSSGIAFDGANIWVNGNVLTKLRASDGACVGSCTFPFAGAAPNGVAFDGANIWVQTGAFSVTRVRASDGACVGTCTFTYGTAPVPVVSSNAVAFDGANIWVTDQSNNNVTKL